MHRLFNAEKLNIKLPEMSKIFILSLLALFVQIIAALFL